MNELTNKIGVAYRTFEYPEGLRVECFIPLRKLSGWGAEMLWCYQPGDGMEWIPS